MSIQSYSLLSSSYPVESVLVQVLAVSYACPMPVASTRISYIVYTGVTQSAIDSPVRLIVILIFLRYPSDQVGRTIDTLLLASWLVPLAPQEVTLHLS